MTPPGLCDCTEIFAPGSMVSFTFGPIVDEDDAVTVFVLEENSDVYTLTLPIHDTQTSVRFYTSTLSCRLISINEFQSMFSIPFS